MSKDLLKVPKHSYSLRGGYPAYKASTLTNRLTYPNHQFKPAETLSLGNLLWIYVSCMYNYCAMTSMTVDEEQKIQARKSTGGHELQQARSNMQTG